MDRRKFISSSAVGAAAAVLVNTPGGGARAAGLKEALKPALMKLGATVGRCEDENLKAVARYGVTHVVGNAQIAESGRLYATADELKRAREIVERNKLSLAVITPPNLGSSHIDRERNPAI